jgi:hypothetical protein
MDLREIGWDDVDCINVVRNMDKWRALVNTVMSCFICLASSLEILKEKHNNETFHCFGEGG